MNEKTGNLVTHIDGSVHATKTEVGRNGSDRPWMAVSRCGIEFELDDTVEPNVSKDMIAGIMMGDEITCEACKVLNP